MVLPCLATAWSAIMPNKKNEKSSLPVIAGVIGILGLVVVGGLYASTLKMNSTTTTEAAVAPAAGDEKEISTSSDEALEEEDEQVQAAENKPDAAVAADEQAEDDAEVADSNEAEDVKIAESPELAALTKPRALGNPSSPLKISEHSSFTCPHCAMFHADIYKKIKTDYVDTGKAYIVFDDFPRNIVDLEIGMVARCLPESSYFNFVQLMFETQDKWASENEYKKFTKQNAMLAGLGDVQYEECLANKDLQEALAAHREVAMNKFGINGTPTLVINDKVVMSALVPYNQIKDALDSELAKTNKK